MDINTNTLQLQSAVITPLKVTNIRKPVDSAIADANVKVAAQPNTSETTLVSKEKESDDLKQAVTKLNDVVQAVQRNLQFSVDKDSGVMVVKVIDAKSEKVIRQMPTEETLRLARSIEEQQNEDASISIFSSKA